MPFCPICHAEFREGITVCADCDIELVDSLEKVRPKMDEESMAAYLGEKELVVIASAGLERLKPLKNLLCENAIANIIVKQSASCIGGGCAPTLELAVAVEDIERAYTAIHSEFKDLVATVSSDERDLVRVDRSIDLDGGEMKCPACDCAIPAGGDECPECGLYIGVPEEFLEEAEDK